MAGYEYYMDPGAFLPPPVLRDCIHYEFRSNYDASGVWLGCGGYCRIKDCRCGATCPDYVRAEDAIDLEDNE